jgi:hypothetical protein
MELGKTAYPPKPQMVVRVGITGHRPKDLSKVDLNTLGGTIRHVLSTIRKEAGDILAENNSFYAAGGPKLRLISALAEGSDRIVAGIAGQLGYEIESPIPFAKDIYEGTFTDTESQERSIIEFESLLAQSTRILILDGTKEAPEKAYEAVGRAMLRHSDVLISIWNGQPPEPGGTGQITAEAIQHNVPTIWISTDSPEKAYLLNEITEDGRAGKSIDFEPDIHKRLNDALSLPSKREKQALKRYYKERSFQPKLATTSTPSTQEVSSIAAPEPLQSAFTWADELANSYASCYRRSFIATYLLGACAVLAAFLGYARWESLFKVELAIIIAILSIVIVNRIRHWHDRWIDYRILAEWLRQMRFLYPFSRITPTLKVPAYLGDYDPGPTWFNWYFRALVRQIGMPSTKFDIDYAKKCRALLLQSIADQELYHEGKAERFHFIHHSLHVLTLVAFGTTLLACILHIRFEHAIAVLLGEHTAMALTILAIGSPAIGAALEGINHQGEFERMSRRSKSIKNRISDLAKRVPAEDKNLSFRNLGRLAEEFCELQVSEQTDWRSVFIGKDVNPS